MSRPDEAAGRRGSGNVSGRLESPPHAGRMKDEERGSYRGRGSVKLLANVVCLLYVIILVCGLRAVVVNEA